MRAGVPKKRGDSKASTPRTNARTARTPEGVGEVLAAARDAFGDVHVLVNNVGGVFHRWFLDSPEKAWDAMLRVNLRSVLHGTSLVGQHMRAHGRGGSILNVVTIVQRGFRGRANLTLHSQFPRQPSRQVRRSPDRRRSHVQVQIVHDVFGDVFAHQCLTWP